MRHRLAAAGLLVMVWAGQARADEAGAIAAIEKLGGAVFSSDPKTGQRNDVVEFWGKPEISDADLAKAAEPLRRLPKLRTLMLDYTRVTDAGLKHLEGLTGLESLSLKVTRVTDAGFEHLKGLRRLKKVELNLTGVTDRGVAAFRKARPDVEVAVTGPGEPAGEAAKLRGRWRSIKGEAGAEPPEGLGDATLIVDGDELALFIESRLLFLCRFRLDSAAKSKGGTCAITAVLPGFNSRGAGFAFAYKLDGDTLTMCLGSTDHPSERPRALSSKAGHLFVFKRETKKSEAAKGDAPQS